MQTQKRKFGDLGEQLAAGFLEKKGYKILDRNFRTRSGELDIVAAKTSGFLNSRIEKIIFVEVKSINEGETFLAAQNVNFSKQSKLKKASQEYLIQKRIKPGIPWQIDVIAVSIKKEKPQIDHLENAVWE